MNAPPTDRLHGPSYLYWFRQGTCQGNTAESGADHVASLLGCHHCNLVPLPLEAPPRIVNARPHTHTLQALIVGMCPSTIALPPTGAVPREQKQSIVSSLHQPKKQALSPQTWSTRWPDTLIACREFEGLTVDSTMNGSAHDRCVSMGDPGFSSLKAIPRSPGSPTLAARTEILWLIDFSKVAGPGELLLPSSAVVLERAICRR